MKSAPSVSIARDFSIPRLLSTALFLVAMVAQVVIAWRFWALTWDDSAITLGFARTFALTGKIEPTPHSGVVEGYSTTLWMLLMTLVAKFVSAPSTLLTAAKLLSLALNIANLYLIKKWFSSWMPTELGAMAAGIFGCSFMFYETINGMETPLLLALILSMLLLRERQGSVARWSYLAAGVALIMTRWEAAWFLVPFVLLERPIRFALKSGSVWASAFITINLVRRWYFGSFLPNTIIAKHGAPYILGTARDQLSQRFSQLHDIFNGCQYVILALFIYSLYRSFTQESKRQSMPWEFRFTALFLLFSVGLTVAIGKNWGPVLRSFYSAWPFLFGFLLFPLATDFAVPARRRSLSILLTVLSVLSFYSMSRAIKEMKAADAPVYMADATVDKIKVISDTLGKIQEATQHHNLLFAGPDMGAVLLYSNGVRVIDLGLLCNKTLARERYGAFETYVLQQERPDVIEVHGMWTTLTGVEKSTRFHENYTPVVIDGKRIFLRKDLIASIPISRLREVTYLPDERRAANASEGASDPADLALDKSFTHHLVLD